jgi:hypothetical protein
MQYLGQILECLDPESQSESGTTINRPGESRTEKDQESLESKKTRSVWYQKKKTNKLGESGTGRKKTGGENIRRVWTRKRQHQESLEPEERTPGKFGTGRGETGKL